MIQMKWLSVRSRDSIAGLIGDFAKIVLAGYFAGEFFVKLLLLQKLIFWSIFAFFVVLYLALVIEIGEQR
ncbi:MAG: hypothetical protein KKG01_01550 [Candidatus Omnitrophica bacterium]|nr:hypothetical protein [Candidatus Omnitrophota bacterium]